MITHIRHRGLLATISIASLLAAACASNTPKRSRGESFACSGPFSRYTSAETLASYFGASNVVRGTIDTGEGESEQGTVLFPNSEEKRMEILWKDQRKQRDLRMIRISGDSSDWSAFPGVRLGMRVPEVEFLNRGPFRIYGFSWDYGGTVSEWNGGFLSQESGEGCRMIVRFDLPADAPDHPFQGEEQFDSSDVELQKLEPTVHQIILVID